MTKYQKLSINTIDFFHKVCYTQIKLENKTNILTNKTKTNIKLIKIKRNQMAINTFKIPTSYQYYEGEASYVSPAEVSDETLTRIKNRRIGAKISEIMFR